MIVATALNFTPCYHPLHNLYVKLLLEFILKSINLDVSALRLLSVWMCVEKSLTSWMHIIIRQSRKKKVEIIHLMITKSISLNCSHHIGHKPFHCERIWCAIFHTSHIFTVIQCRQCKKKPAYLCTVTLSCDNFYLC